MLFRSTDGSEVCATVIGEGMDSADKSSNKAMAVAFKYACFQVFCIPTEEMAKDDPDAYSPEESTKAQPQQRQQAAPQPVPAQRRQRVLEYLQKLDDITLSSFKQSFMFNSLSDISDDTINAIANYLNKQIKK